MIRDQALKILADLSNSSNMTKHALAAEAAMRALARKFKKRAKPGSSGAQNSKIKIDEINEDEWGIVGLLHDADYEATNKDLVIHTDKVCEKLQQLNAKQEIIDAIRGHCDKIPRMTFAAKAIYAADELTGLIVATALVMPDKKLASVSVESVLKKFKDPSFARGANRDQIKTAESELNIPLPEFVEITLKSMQEISDNLGL